MARGNRKLVRRRKQLNRKLTAKSLRLETLEARQLLATLTWDGSAGDNLLINPVNWTPDGLPGPADDVVFQDAGAGTLTLDGNPAQVNSITFENSLGNDFTLTDGSFTVNAITQTGSGSNTIDVKILSTNLVGEISDGRLALTDTSNDIQGTWSVLGNSAALDQIESWTVTSEGGHTDPWAWSGGAFTTDGSQIGTPDQHTRLTSPVVTASSDGPVELSFDHHYSIEGGMWDAGGVFVSVNGGAFTQVPNADFSQNGYTVTSSIGAHALFEGEGFGGDSPGFPDNITSVANLGTFNAGDEIAVQFLMANDHSAVGNFTPNWAIDSVQIGDLLDQDFDYTFGTLSATGASGASALGSADVNLDGGTLELASGQVLSNVLQASVYINGDTSDNALLNIGDGTGTGGLLGQTPVQTKLITQPIIFHSDAEFRAYFDGLLQDDNYQTMFDGFVNIPDRNGDGSAYDVEFGTNQSDDPTVIYVDLDQNGVFENATGEQILYRACCGNGYNIVNMAPGTYRYMATHAERGGGSQIEPTIDLFDGAGRRVVAPGTMNGLFTALTPGPFEISNSISVAGNSAVSMSGLMESASLGELSLAGGSTLRTSAGATGAELTFGGAVSINGNSTIAVEGDMQAILSGALGGDLAAELTKEGSGTLVNLATNVRTGETHVNGGTFVVGHDGANSALGSGDVVLDGGTLEVRDVPVTEIEVFGALEASVYINGDTSDNALLNIGDGTGVGGLLGQTPVQTKAITQAINFQNDGQFRAFFEGLQQDDNYQTMFEGLVHIPDKNGDGSAYDVEFGTRRADDPVVIYVDLNQDGVLSNADGEQILYRPCCGDGYVTINIAPGTYPYMATHAERGGGSQIEPTIDLFDGNGRQTVDPGAMGNLFSAFLMPDVANPSLSNVVRVEGAGSGINLGDAENLTFAELQVSDGGELNLTGTGETRFTISGSTTLVGNGTISPQGELTAELAGVVGGDALTKGGSSALILSNNNTYAGLTSIVEGRLVAANANALGTTAAGVVSDPGAELALDGGFTLNPGESLDLGGGITNVSGNNVIDQDVNFDAGASTISSLADTLTINGNVDIDGTILTFAGDGNITVNGDMSGGVAVAQGAILGSFYNLAANGTNGNASLLNPTVSNTLPLPLQNAPPVISNIISPRVDFGDGAEGAAPGDGTVLDRGGTNEVFDGSNYLDAAGNAFTVDMPADNVQGVWTGKIDIPENGDYQFTTRSDDGTVLYIDGNLVVDNNFFQGMTNRSGVVTLTAGPHDILVSGYEGGGGAGFQASWEEISPNPFPREIIPANVLFNDVANPGTFVAGGLRTDLYTQTSSEGLLRTTGLPIPLDGLTPVAVLPVTDINHPSTGGNPFAGIGVNLPVEDHAAKWVGKLIVPEDATYRLSIESDDGSMLFVDGVLVANNNGDHGMVKVNADLFLTAGQHDYYTAFYERGGGAGMIARIQQLDGNNPFAERLIGGDDFAIESTAEVIKTGNGAVTLAGNNSYVGATTVLGGTLVAASDTALGTSDVGTTMSSGTLALSSGANISEAIHLADGSGEIRNLDGDNSLLGALTTDVNAAGGEIRLVSEAGTLTVNSDLNLEFAILTVAGDGDTVIHGAISGAGASTAPLQPVYNFDGNPNDLEGWTVSSGTPGAQGGQDGQVTSGMTGQFGSFAHDAAHETYRLTSPVFTLNGSGDLTFVMRGGDTNGRSAPANLADVPANSLAEGDATAFQGLILRNVATNDIVLSGNSANQSGDLLTGAFSAAELAALEAANPGAQYVAEFLDFFHGGWGWVNLDSVAIPGDGGVIESKNDVVKTGGGTLTLTGENTYNGDTRIEQGSLVAANDSALGDTARGTIVEESGSLVLDNTHLPAGDASGNVELPAGETITINGSRTLQESDTLSYGFDGNPNNLDGWTVSAGTAGAQGGQDGQVTSGMTGQFGSFAHDAAHETYRLTSPVFTLNGSGDLTFVMRGGDTNGRSAPANLADVPANSLDQGNAQAFQGLILRDVATNDIVLSGNSANQSGNLNTGAFSAADLAALEASNPNAQYVAEFLDFFHGGWGWVNLDSVSIPGDLITSGHIQNQAGDNRVLGNISAGVGTAANEISSVGGSLTIDGDIDMGARSLIVSGNSDVVINGSMVGTGQPELVPGVNARFYMMGRDAQATLLEPNSQTGPIGLQAQVPAATALTPEINFPSVGDNPFASIGVDVGIDQIGALWTGFINAPESARYLFDTTSDDGTAMWIDINKDGDFDDVGEHVVENNRPQGMTTRSGGATLDAGMYPIMIGFYEGGGGAGVEVRWQQLNGANPFGRQIIPSSVLFDDAMNPGGLTGNFYSNVGAADSLLRHTGPEGSIIELEHFGPYDEKFVTWVDFGAGTESTPGDGSNIRRGGTTGNPFGGVGVADSPGNDRHGAIFDGMLEITAEGDYTFNARSDDGNILWIDGNQVLSDNSPHGMRDAFGTVTLTPGFHEVKAAFWENGGGSGYQINYSGPDTGGNEIAIPPSAFGHIQQPDNQLIKTGNGALTLTGDNSYGDGTTVMGGILLVANTAGSATGDGPVTIKSGGTLGGDGSISGDVVAQAGGATSPGLAPGQTATLSTGNYTLEPGAFGIKELTSSGHDQTNVTGTVTLTDAIAVGIMENGYRPVNGETFVLINNDGNDAIVGELVGIPEGGLVELSNGDTNRLFSVSYVGGDGNDFEITYINRAPVYDAGGPYTIGEGDSLTLDAGGSVDEDLDPISYSWDINGDGVFGDATGVNPTLSWAELNALGIDDGPDSFNVTVMGDDGELSGDATTTLTLDNVAPTAEIDGDTMGVPNRPLSFTLRAFGEPAQPDRDAGYTYVVDWGDGSVDTFGPGETDTIFVEHAFGDFGALNVVLTVSDKDGGSSTATLPVDISPVAQIGDTLYVGGTDGRNDRIEVRAAGLEQIDVRYNDIRYGRFQPARVVIYGGDGKDRITVNATLPAEVYGEEGADYIALSSADDIVFGGPGRDTILVGSGNNWVDGGEGNDSVIAREGNDELHGGAGNDRIDGGSGDDLLYGDAGNDQLIGGNGNDLLVGGAGNDAIFGQGGIDVIIGGDGNDKNRGGSGDDLIIGGFGADGLKGERGDDTLNSGDAQLADDSDAQLALLAEWVSSRSYNSIGSFFDDGDKDGMDGGGGPDEIYFGSNDSLSLVRDNDSLFLL